MKKNAVEAVLVTLALMWLSRTGIAQNFGPWQTPLNLGPVVNSACSDMHPTLSKDSLTLIFSSTRPFDHVATSTTDCLPALHLWGTQRATVDSPWPRPIPLPINMPSNSPYEDHAPNLTTDGHWLIFHSKRPGDQQNPSCNGGGYQELWASHRQDSSNLLAWEAPINLGCTLNVPFADNAGPNIFEDSATGTFYLYFTRDLTPNGLGTDPAGNGYDIYVSTCSADLRNCFVGQLWRPAAFEANLSSPIRDTRTGIRRRDGLEMLVTSNRTGTAGALDMWVSRRSSPQAAWSVPENLNTDNIDQGGAPNLNTTANDGGPVLSWDATTMIFYSARPGGLGGNDLYISTRQKLTGSK